MVFRSPSDASDDDDADADGADAGDDADDDAADDAGERLRAEAAELSELSPPAYLCRSLLESLISS